MASKQTFIVGLCVLIAALLIICVGLLSAIFDVEKNRKETPQVQPPSPQYAKNVVVLADASSGVDSTVLGREADFLNTQLRERLLAELSGYHIRIAASAFASQLSSQLSYVDLSDTNAVKQLADTIRGSNTNQALDIGTVLSSLQTRQRAGPLGQHTLIVLASGQGQNYANAIAQAQSLKNDGVEIITASLKSNGADLAQLASSGNNFDGQAIASGDTQGMENLAGRVASVVANQPPVPLTTTAPPPTTTTTTTTSSTSTTTTTSTTSTTTTTSTTSTTTTAPPQPPITTTTSSTSTTTTTPQSPPITTTSSSTSTTTTTTARPPASTRVLVLVDASNGVTQKEMLAQTSFVTTKLVESFMYPSTHGYDTTVLIVPYAFDTSPDNSEYITLDDGLAMSKQAMNTKLAPITTFVEPLDILQIGEAFAEVERSEKPTHVVVLASGQGTDYQKAVTIAQRLTQANVKIISVATVGAASDLKDITSDGICALDGREILTGQNLESVANNIAKCIYPQSALPPKSKPKVIARAVAESPKPKPKVVYEEPKAPKAPKTLKAEVVSTDIIVLVDTSSYAVNDGCIKKQSNFISNYLVKALADTFITDNPRIAVIPYAFFMGAVAEEFAIIGATNTSLLESQLRTARVAPITTFMHPLNEHKLSSTLMLLIESYFIQSKNAKVLLMADDPYPNTHVPDAIPYAKNITDSHKALVVVSLTGMHSYYTVIAGIRNVFDGASIKSSDTVQQESLAKTVSAALKTYIYPLADEPHLVHVPARTQSFGA